MKAPIAAVASINSIIADAKGISLLVTVRPQAEAANKMVGSYKVTALQDGKVSEVERPRTLRIPYEGTANLQSGQSIGFVISDFKNPSQGAKYADCQATVTGTSGSLKDLFEEASKVAEGMPASPAATDAPF